MAAPVLCPRPTPVHRRLRQPSSQGCSEPSKWRGRQMRKLPTITVGQRLVDVRGQHPVVVEVVVVLALNLRRVSSFKNQRCKACANV